MKFYYLFFMVIILGLFPFSVLAQEFILSDSYIYAPQEHIYQKTTIKLTDKRISQVELNKVLSAELGCAVNFSGGFYQPSFVSIRGSKTSGVLIMIDNVQLNAFGESVDLSTLNLDNYEEIEIYRGAVNGNNSQNFFGGAINLISKKKNINNNFYTKLADFQTYGLGFNLNERINTFPIAISYEHLYSRNDFLFFNNKATPINPLDDSYDRRSNNEVFNDNFNFTMKTDEFNPNTLNFNYYHNKKGVPGTIFNPSYFAYKNETKQLINLFSQKLIFDNQIIKAQINYLNNNFNFFDPKHEYSSSILANLYYGNSYLGELNYQLLFDDLNISAKLKAQNETLFRKNLTASNTTEVKYPDRNLISAGLDFKYENDSAFNLLFSNNFSYFFNEGFYSAHLLGSEIKLGSDISLFNHISNSFRMPSFSEKYIAWGPYYNNPDLRPETVQEIEIGFKNTQGSFLVTGAYFKRWVKDLIELNLSSAFMIKPINIGSAEIDGLELSLKYIWDRFSLRNDYSLLFTRDTTPGSQWQNYPIIGQPLNIVSLVLEYSATKELFFFTEYIYKGNHYTTIGSLTKLPDQNLVNLGSKWQIANNLDFNFRINNLLNGYYYDTYGFPLPGINWESSLIWRF